MRESTCLYVRSAVLDGTASPRPNVTKKVERRRGNHHDSSRLSFGAPFFLMWAQHNVELSISWSGVYPKYDGLLDTPFMIKELTSLNIFSLDIAVIYRFHVFLSHLVYLLA
jgi:hypothetical protein